MWRGGGSRREILTLERPMRKPEEISCKDNCPQDMSGVDPPITRCESL